jgi:hypothetical protein
MIKLITAVAVAGLALTVIVAPKPALAENGEIAAGVVGGLAVGAIVGSQMNRDDGYRGYGYRHRARYGDCHVERREFEDRYGRIHVRRIRVCD